MSKVYSFRLDENNPREAQAREVIEAWAKEGYSFRHLMAEAVIGYQNGAENNVDYEVMLEKLTQLLLNANLVIPIDREVTNTQLSPAFLNAVSRSVRAGTRIG